MPLTHLPSTTGGPRGIGNIEFPSVSRATVIGITFAIAGNVLISFALNLQKLAHARLDAARSQHGPGPEAVEPESDASDSDTSAGCARVGSDVQREPSLPPEVEREAREWHGSRFDTSLQLDPHLETDPLIAFPPTASMEVPPIAQTYGALFPNTYEGHVRGVTPPRRYPKGSKQPGVGFANKNTNRPNYHGPKNESEYLKSKLWYVSLSSTELPVSEATTTCRWFGFLLMNVGETGNFISYAFAPASVVAPLGTVIYIFSSICQRGLTHLQFAVIANCLFAPFLLHEQLRKVRRHHLSWYWSGSIPIPA